MALLLCFVSIFRKQEPPSTHKCVPNYREFTVVRGNQIVDYLDCDLRVFESSVELGQAHVLGELLEEDLDEDAAG